jgi:voltage-gated potassium channel
VVHRTGSLFTYFSFITLMPVGYGDVTPLSATARTCAWLEALTGQFYLAVLVAGLVGAILAKKPQPGEAGNQTLPILPMTG